MNWESNPRLDSLRALKTFTDKQGNRYRLDRHADGVAYATRIDEGAPHQTMFAGCASVIPDP